MACFILTHKLAKEFSQEEVLHCAKELVAHLPRDVKWQMSWYVPDQNHLLCHFEASSADAVRRALDESGVSHIFPILKIQEAIEIVPGAYAPHKRPVRSPVRSRLN